MRVFKAKSHFCGRTMSGYALVCEKMEEWGDYLREGELYQALKKKLDITDSEVVAVACAESVDWDKNIIEILSQETTVFLGEEIK